MRICHTGAWVGHNRELDLVPLYKTTDIQLCWVTNCLLLKFTVYCPLEEPKKSRNTKDIFENHLA